MWEVTAGRCASLSRQVREQRCDDTTGRENKDGQTKATRDRAEPRHMPAPTSHDGDDRWEETNEEERKQT